ncbi:MAG: BatA and WFA domain-containing protein [Planctomycetales bacterium]|nr:BatA and WFA domain-containing protein [Planctomycetales bacterium]
MSLLVPLGLLGLLAVPAVVLLYFLKLRRREMTVGSTLLWRRSVHDLRVNTPFQRLRKSLLLLLQCLVIGLIALALARPLVGLGEAGRCVAILVDVSASMAVVERGVPRIARAKAAAEEAIAGLGRGDEAMLLAFGSRAEVLQSLTGTAPLLRDALGRVQARETGTDAREALSIALSALKGRENPEVILISDGAVGPLPEIPPEAEAPVRLVLVGEERRNVGLTGIEVRAPPDPGAGPEVFVRVQNYGPEAVSAVVECRIAGTLLDARSVAVAPDGEASAVFPVPAAAVGLVECRLAAGDSFATDDAVRTLLRPPPETQVLLVSAGKHALLGAERALALMAQTVVRRMSPEAYAAGGPGDPVPDVVVLDGCSGTDLREGAFLVLGGSLPFPGLEDEGEVTFPTLLDWNRTHPVARFLSGLSTVQIAKARKWKLPEEAHVLVEAEEGPLVATLARGRTRAVLVSFDPFDQSDWVLRSSFPLFVANAVEWLSGAGERSRGEHQRTAEPLLLRPLPGVSECVVRDPGGTLHAVPVGGGGLPLFAGTERAGIYEVVSGEREPRSVAANLCDPAESAIAPVEKLKLPGKEVAAIRAVPEGRREVWRQAILLAFLLLLLEWYIYHRRSM